MEDKVLQFATDMQYELNQNTKNKGNWEDWDGSVEEMLYELEYHKAKLMFALKNNDQALVREHIADCGNILMFIGNKYQLYT